ncbi:uncharacterized protein LOC123546025 isoform X8 [Mercenaria mercenaria]|uniref:uncharacterized protein LOC123546025 isoform X8 n=1 Tax=Mercenaria mercenaria TaxID=6596 RepID=UPI00234F4C33|nr:uncharacterized protein LOC123546025 isoform X8 [Mercenaria mercenaria]
MQEKRYGKMDKYLLTIMVTFEQEYAIQKLFGRHGWEYSKITDEISLKDFKSGEKSSPEIQPELNQQSCVKKTVASDSSKIVTSNDDKDSSNTPRHETAIPAVKFSMQNDVNNMLDNSINSEADAYHNDEGDGDDDYGGDTDTEQTLMSLGIVVKEELESGDDDDKASEHDVDSINKRSSNVKPSGKGKRSAQSKAETRNKKKRKQATSTVPSAEVEDNVDKGESEVKLEGLSAEDQGTDDPLAVLETLPDIEHVSKVVSSNTHDVETFLTGPDDVDESGYSVSLSLYFCRDCQYTFPEEKYYTLHKRSGKCVFQCQFCDKKYTFKNFSQYQEHLKQHRPDDTGELVQTSVWSAQEKSPRRSPRRHQQPNRLEHEVCELRSSVTNLEFWHKQMWNDVVYLKGAVESLQQQRQLHSETPQHEQKTHLFEFAIPPPLRSLALSTASASSSFSGREVTFKGFTKDQLKEKMRIYKNFSKGTTVAFRLLFSKEEVEGRSLAGQKGNKGEARQPLEDRAKLSFLEDCLMEAFPGTRREQIREVIRHLLKPSRNNYKKMTN